MNKFHTVMEKTFRNIYLHHKWFNGSGSGSLIENTKDYRAFLQKFLRDKDIKTVLDLGCGDWQSTRFVSWKGVQYTGIDTVPHIIDEVRKQFESDNIQFIYADITETELPNADLVIVKDVLQHWPNEIIKQFLGRLQPYKYILVTETVETWDMTDPDNPTDITGAVNRDIELGDGRALDISKPPFNLKGKELLRYPSVKRHRPVRDVKAVMLLQNL